MIAIARNREEAEDITATAFASAFKNLDRFRGNALPQTWLHAIAMNEARSLRRSRTVPLESIDRTDAKELTEPDLLAQALERSECCTKIRAALRRIPVTYRRILVDRFVSGASVRQIARRNGIPAGTVLSRILTAKRLLRAVWET